MQHVTYTIKPSTVGPVCLFSNDPKEVEKRKKMRQESEENEAREKESLSQINRAINCEIGKIKL